MAMKLIEKELNGHYLITDFDVDIEHEKAKYTVDITIINPQENEDFSNLLILKNKIRGLVNRAFRIEFNIKFTA